MSIARCDLTKLDAHNQAKTSRYLERNNVIVKSLHQPATTATYEDDNADENNDTNDN